MIRIKQKEGNLLNLLKLENITVLHECKDGTKDIHRTYGPISGIDHIVMKSIKNY